MVDAADGPTKPAQMTAVRAAISFSRDKLGDWAAAERTQAGLWVPALFGAGAAVYLQLSDEPPIVAPLIFLTFCLIAVLVHERFRLYWLGFGLVCLGFVWTDFRTQQISAPTIHEELRFASITGTLLTVDEAPKFRRLVINVESISGLAPEQTPARIRVSWRGREFGAHAGERIRIVANLSPPPRPAAPGGFDFARQLYFQKIGAVGYAISAPENLGGGESSALSRIGGIVESMRGALAGRIIEKTAGDAGAIVAAVVTGKRAAISERAENAFRDSGLAHLLSISGLHMGLATGLIFFLVRAAMTCH